jgi:hypothetical protein
MPGTDENIWSTWNDGGYEELAGTSQATPHVSGVAALLVSVGVGGQSAVQRILATATDLGTPGPDVQFGAGLVNAQAAVAGLGARSGVGGVRRRSAARVTIKRRQHIRAVLRRGIRISCTAAGNGTCSAKAIYRHATLARGAAHAALGQTTHLRAMPTRKGRRVLKAALHHRRTLRVRVRVRLPGAAVTRRVFLVPGS